MPSQKCNLLIIGSGPAGCTAAIYAARDNLEPIVIEGIQPGGQLTLTTEIENFPGFPDGILGPELMENMKKQAMKFGAKFIFENVEHVNFKQKPFLITADSQAYSADAVIIASGASARWLGLESEKKFRGYGVSACATCDAFFFKGKKVAVTGGGDSALEEAIFLSKFASEVFVIHRRDKLRASPIMQEKVFSNPKIKFVWDTLVEEILGTEEPLKVTGIKLKNKKTEEITELSCDGVFMSIGHTPNTELFKGQIDMDEKGYIITKEGTKTSIPGIFAAGDVQDHIYKQAVTAAGTGCMAAIDARKYLEELESKS
jgi:thioredoxin reductase (NADPH)